VSKWEKHIGDIEFKVGDDTFKMRPSVSDWLKLQKMYNGKYEKDANNVTPEEMEEMVNIIVEAMVRAEGEANRQNVIAFVGSNFFACANAFTNMLKNDNKIKDFVEEQKAKIGGGVGSKPGQAKE
jgi:hypothetical protein